MSKDKDEKRVSFFLENVEEKDAEEKAKSKKEIPPDRQYLRDFLKRSLGLGSPPEQLLSSLNLEGVAEYIKNKNCRNIITMAGAGISTSAGIPDFRSPRTGLYDNLEKYNLPSPQSVFDIYYFKENQEPFYALAREMWPGKFKPTPCHYFIKMLDNKGLLLRHYTQNIDSLEFYAGLDPEKMVEAHGTYRYGHCIFCNEPYREDWITEKVFAGKVPKCEDCNSPVKPDIVFFGESLPDRFRECSQEDFHQCDLLIIMGTSLLVQPFASLTMRVPETTPRIYINLEKTGNESAHPLTTLIFGGGFKFDDEDNYRDVFCKGPCDSGCYELADLIGWGEEFKQMIKENNERMEKEIAANEERLSEIKQSSVETSTMSSSNESTSSDKSEEKIKDGNVLKNDSKYESSLETATEKNKDGISFKDARKATVNTMPGKPPANAQNKGHLKESHKPDTVKSSTATGKSSTTVSSKTMVAKSAKSTQSSGAVKYTPSSGPVKESIKQKANKSLASSKVKK